jgi:hypothetical protein
LAFWASSYFFCIGLACDWYLPHWAAGIGFYLVVASFGLGNVK